jgi:hypothetical protein
MYGGPVKIWIGPHAYTVPFDNATNGFVADNTQGAIEELKTLISNTLSPGYPFGKSGTVTSGSWLWRVGDIPANKAGYNVGALNPILYRINCGSENLNTYTISVYQHDGNEVGLTLITSVNVIASRKAVFNVNVALTSNRHIAVQLSAGSAKNVGVDLQATGVVV